MIDGYDPGGAHWGNALPPDSLYAVWGWTIKGDPWMYYVRAASRFDAHRTAKEHAKRLGFLIH